MRYRLLWMLFCFGCGMSDTGPNPSEGLDSDLVFSGEPACQDCEIIMREVAILGDSGDPSSVRDDAAGTSCMVGRLSSGEYLMGGAVGGGEIYVYDGPGTRSRVLGKRGGGPGEFGTTIRFAVGPGDTLYIMDVSHARVQILTPAGDFVRSFPLKGRLRNFALLQGGDLLFHYALAQRKDPLFHLVTSDGSEEARFGKTTETEVDLEQQVMSPARQQGFWTGSIWRYEVQHWVTPDSLARRVSREAKWFPPDGGYPEGLYETASPPPFLDHIWEDDDGLLWLYTLVPDAAWRPGLGLRPNPEWYRKTFDTVIEVIDLQSGQLLAQSRYDGKLGAVCGSGLMYTVVETPDGDNRVQLFEPALERSRGEVRR